MRRLEITVALAATKCRSLDRQPQTERSQLARDKASTPSISDFFPVDRHVKSRFLVQMNLKPPALLLRVLLTCPDFRRRLA